MAKDDAAKLAILLSHWIEHNEEHAGEFMEWAMKAKAGGKTAVHDHIVQAVKEIGAANRSLLAALEGLKED